MSLVHMWVLIGVKAPSRMKLLLTVAQRCSQTVVCLLNLTPDGTEYGLSEADMEASYATLKSMAEQIEADVILLREHQEAGGKVQDYLVRKRVGDNDFLEVR